jgi:2-C-methyl-D-erythritol 4-phosphate cytidylyltransferase
MKYYAIVVAGGSGSRMNTAVAKQFLLLNGKPVLMHTLEKFNACVLNPEIILVLNIHQHQYWEDLCEQYNFTVAHRLVKGGVQRFHSVHNGLKTIKGNGIVAVHDAVRPLVSDNLILQSYQTAERSGTAVAAVQPTDSVRMIKGEQTQALKREELFLIQTPQTFEVNALKKAYGADYRNDFTDDASVAEHAGQRIVIIPGSSENIKITFPQDLELAELLIQKKASE